MREGSRLCARDIAESSFFRDGRFLHADHYSPGVLRSFCPAIAVALAQSSFAGGPARIEMSKLPAPEEGLELG